MKRPRKTRNTVWYNERGNLIDYTEHPGAVMARYLQWVKPVDGMTTSTGPDPDVVNVGLLSTRPILMDIEHEYFIKPDPKSPFWISFGWSENPMRTIACVDEPWMGFWISDKNREPREIKYPTVPDNIMAKNFPKEHRWKYNDIGDY